jgi:hypothetical protein
MSLGHIWIKTIDPPVGFLSDLGSQIDLLEHLLNGDWHFTLYLADGAKKMSKVVWDLYRFPSVFWRRKHVVVDHVEDRGCELVATPCVCPQVFMPVRNYMKHVLVIVKYIGGRAVA